MSRIKGLKYIYQAIEGQAMSIIDENGEQRFKEFHTWNNQFKQILGKPGQSSEVSLPYPAIFYEVVIDSIEEQGLYNQLWNCTLNLHIAHQEMNAAKGELDQNWEVFDLIDEVHESFQGFKYPLFNTMINIGALQDYSHGNLYHFVDSFKFNFEYFYDYSQKFIDYTGETLNLFVTINSGCTLTQI